MFVFLSRACIEEFQGIFSSTCMFAHILEITAINRVKCVIYDNLASVYMKTLRPINIKQGKTTNPNSSFFTEKSCSGGIRTHDTLLARQML